MLAADFTSLGVLASCHFGLMTYVPLATNSAEVSTDGSENINLFNPHPSFTWHQWMDAAVKLGARSVFLTAKHVDGFCLWPSAATPGRSISDTTWYANNNHRNVFKEFCDIARARGLSVGVYFAVGDSYLWTQNGNAFPAAYVNSIKAQLTELLGGTYGLLDYIFLDAWGDTWGSGSAPNFTSIPLATINNHVASLQPGCLIMNNDHNDSYGAIRLHECPVDGERKSGYTTKPVALHRPLQTTNKWFSHSDSLTEAVQPAARLAALSQNRMLLRSYCIIHNFSPRPDGFLSDDLLAIVDEFRNTYISSLWSGLESEWKLDASSGDESDTAGGGRNTSVTTLTAVNSPGTAAGTIGTARTFNGSTQRFTCPTLDYTTNPLAHGDRTFSYVVWFYPTSFTPDFGAVFGKDDGNGNTTEILLYLNGGVPTWRLSGNGVAFQDLAAAGAVTVNTWNLAICSHDATADKQYLQINGGTRRSSDWSSGVAESISPFTVGCRGAGLLPYTGRVDNLLLFKDRVFTAAEGLAMYNSGSGLATLARPPITGNAPPYHFTGISVGI